MTQMCFSMGVARQTKSRQNESRQNEPKPNNRDNHLAMGNNCRVSAAQLGYCDICRRFKVEAQQLDCSLSPTISGFWFPGTPQILAHVTCSL